LKGLKEAPKAVVKATGEDVISSTVVRRVTQAVAEGAFSKGLSLLVDATKLAPVTPETIAALQVLHPAGVPLPPQAALRRDAPFRCRPQAQAVAQESPLV